MSDFLHHNVFGNSHPNFTYMKATHQKTKQKKKKNLTSKERISLNATINSNKTIILIQN